MNAHSDPSNQNNLEPEVPLSGNQDSSAPVQRTVRSDELLRGNRELFILHGNQIYRLMETRNGKLILQK